MDDDDDDGDGDWFALSTFIAFSVYYLVMIMTMIMRHTGCMTMRMMMMQRFILLASAVKPDGSLPFLEFGGHDVCSDCPSIPHPLACFF